MAEFNKTGDLNKMLRTGKGVISIVVHELNTGTMTSARGDDYLAVSLIYSEVGSDNIKVRTRPVFSKEAQIIIESGPYSVDTEYVVALGYKNGFPVWKKISPEIQSTAA